MQGRHLHNEKYPYNWVSAPRPTPPDASWDHARDTTHFGRNVLKKKDYGRTTAPVKRRNQQKRKESRGRCPTNARKEDERHKGKVVLSLFRDSPKEGALTYTDWCREV